MLHRPTLLSALGGILFTLTGPAAHAQSDSILVGGLERTYTLRLPGAYDGTTLMPLVIAMHGGFGSGTQLEGQSQLTVKADQENFLVVYPDGVASTIGIRTWNAGWCCGYAVNNNIDDVGFIDALIDSLADDHAIDTMRVYATGMSNGGFMSYRLACELSGRIAAIAPVSASMSMIDCAPARSMPVIALYSYQDESVPYLGGIGTGVSAHYNSPLDSVQNAFAAHANCTVLNDTIIDNAEMTVIRWHECDCAQEVITYMTHDGGHSWPGGVQSPIGDPVSIVISANDLMWDFFQQYTLDCDVSTGVPARTPSSGIDLYPNPAATSVTVTGHQLVRITVLDPIGREVLALSTSPADAVHCDVGSLTAGRYVVRTLAKDGSTCASPLVIR